MNNAFSKFNVYDQIGYLLVGAVVLMLAYINFSVFDISFPDFNLTNLPLWIVVAYFFGHVIQAVANILIREKKEDFSEREKEILDLARKYFGLEKGSDGEIWNLCYMFASAKDISGQIQAFNSYYSLYRGWFIVFALESLLITGYILYSFTLIKVVFLFICSVIAILFYRRLKRFSNYLRIKVLQTFILIKTLEE